MIQEPVKIASEASSYGVSQWENHYAPSQGAQQTGLQLRLHSRCLLCVCLLPEPCNAKFASVKKKTVISSEQAGVQPSIEGGRSLETPNQLRPTVSQCDPLWRHHGMTANRLTA